MQYSMTGQQKVIFNAGDCLTEVTSWRGLTVLLFLLCSSKHISILIISINLLTIELIQIQVNVDQVDSVLSLLIYFHCNKFIHSRDSFIPECYVKYFMLFLHIH